MRHFTSLKYASAGSGSSRRLIKALLLSMAMVLFQFTQVHAQDNPDAENTQENTNAVQAIENMQASPRVWMGDGPPPADFFTLDEASYRNARNANADWLPKSSSVDYFIQPNPDLSSNVTCGDLRVVLLLDESGSILNRDGVEQVRESTLGLAQVFQGSPATLTIIEFGSESNVIFSSTVDATYIANLEDYLYDEFDGQSYDPNSIGISEDCFLLYTNWEDALETTIPYQPNLLLFLTDGEPSAYNAVAGDPDPNNCGFVIGSAAFEIGLERSILQANILKTNGTHIFCIGVGTGVQVNNLTLISGDENFADNGDIFTDDYTLGSFEELADDLTAGLNLICGTELEIEKTVDFDQVCSDETVTFTLTVTNMGGSFGLDAVDVVVTDDFPADYTILGIVGAPIAGADITGQILTYNVGDLALGESATIQVEATLSGAALGDYPNTAFANAVNANVINTEQSVEVTDLVTSSTDVAGCESYELVAADFVATPDAGQDETFTPGAFTRTITGLNENGCPTEATVNITVNEPSGSVETEDACGFYVWAVNGETYTASGIYTDVTTGENGQCDFTATLNLTILEAPAPVVEVYSSCTAPFTTPYGTFFSSTIIVSPIEGENGCDGTFTLIINIGVPGTDCNDGDPSTIDDMITADCGCEGTPVICVSPNLSLALSADEAGQEDVADCLDADGTFWVQATIDGGSGNENGYDALVNGVASQVAAEGTFAFGPFNQGTDVTVSIVGIDEGVCGGNESINSPEVCPPTDCNNVVGGTASIDECNVCSGGDTGLVPNASCTDCADVVNGDAETDACGICYAGGASNPLWNTTCADCAGVPNGTATIDACGECTGGTTGIDPCNNPGTDCENYKMYYIALNTPGIVQGTVFEAVVTAGNVQLTELFQSGLNGHMALNTDNGDIYVIDGNGSQIKTFDSDGNELLNVAISGLNSTFALAYDPEDQKLFVGSASANKVYKMDPVTGAYIMFADDVPVNGGDIVVDGDQVFLIERRDSDSSRLYNITSGDDVFVSDIVSKVNGAGQTANGGFIVAEGGSSNSFWTYGFDGSNEQELMAIDENGDDFLVVDGDIASGCDSGNNNEDNCAYALYYRHVASGDSSADGLYSLTLNDDGTADEVFITAEGDNHIALSPDGSLIYMVGGEYIYTYDVGTGDMNFVNITNADGGGNLRGFPGAVTNANGDVFIAGSGNRVWIVNPLSGEASLIANISVNGGDLIFAPTGPGGDEELWIITRNNNTFKRVLDPGNGAFTVDVPEINGAAVLENGNVLLANGDGNGIEGYIEVSLADGSIVDSYDVELPIYNGDLAGGCTSGNNNEICEGDNGDCYGTVDDYVRGTRSNGGPISDSRADLENANGEPERTQTLVFTTLGYDGSIVFSFEGLVPNGPGDDIEVVETSYNTVSCEAYLEYADVSVSQDGINYYFVKTICKFDGFVDIDDAVDANGEPMLFACVNYVKVANNNVLTTTPDGFDVDGIVAIHNCGFNSTPDGNQQAAVIATSSDTDLSSYPNPTAGTSQVVFVTGETTRATLEVYDMNGRNVSTLFNQVANANQEYRLEFDGAELPNGVYIYRLTTSKETIIEKFMIAK